jgi:hypothetical protein
VGNIRAAFRAKAALFARLRLYQKLLICLAVVAIAACIVAGIAALSSDSPGQTGQNNQSPDNSGSQSSGGTGWQYDQNKLEWSFVNGAAPKCPEPLLSVTPVDLSKVTAVGLPGAYRGYSYKAHGGFRLVDGTGGTADLRVPMDTYLTGITRYYESIPGMEPELQYLLDFENDCGIAMRFDHVATLTPAMQALAEKTPEPKLNDTRGTPGQFEKVALKAGDVIATQLGFPKAKNYGFDFGVYDYRSRNEISGNQKWADIHKEYSAQHYHGICWLPLLPGGDAAKAEAMAKDRNNYNSNKPFNLTSDYCSFAPYNTLDFNDGQPTDG